MNYLKIYFKSYRPTHIVDDEGNLYVMDKKKPVRNKQKDFEQTSISVIEIDLREDVERHKNNKKERR